MTDCSIYVGDLNDPTFHWSGGDWNSNSPKRILPAFPPAGDAHNRVFHEWVEAIPALECKQTDFGCWVAKVSNAQLADFLAFAYPEAKPLPWQRGLPQLKKKVAALAPGTYALVATEF